MPRTFKALITVLEESTEGGGEHPDNTLPGFEPHPDQGLPGEQPGIDNSLPPFPSHPIVIPPDAIEPGVPSHPIYIPVYPDNSLPESQPHPDQGLPGEQPRPEHPIIIPPDAIEPGVPTHPIVIPPDGEPPYIDNSLPGGQGGVPTHPIVIPPLPENIQESDKALIMVKTGEQTTWYIIGADDQLRPSGGKKGGSSGKSPAQATTTRRK